MPQSQGQRAPFNPPRVVHRRTSANTNTTGETARQKFTRLGPARVANAVHAIRLLQNFARDEYEVRPQDVEKIKHVLETEVKVTEAALLGDDKGESIIQFDE